MASLTERIYDNESIKSLKGAERVRKRPGVIFGSDGLEGCEHSFFEILSNAIDEAKAGFGNKIIVTGIRADESFLAKVYKTTPWHRVEQITDINNGVLTIKTERAGEG